MSLEMRNRLEVGLGVRLLATALFTYPNLTALGAHLLERLQLAETPSELQRARRRPTTAASSSELAHLSDEDLAQLGEDLLS
jgi:hypothetical protein